MPLIDETIDDLTRFMNRLEVRQLLDTESIYKLYTQEKECVISDNEIAILRQSLSAIVTDDANGKSLCDTTYRVLLALAKYRPLNEKDPILKKRIKPNNAIFVSTGHQFNFESVSIFLEDILTTNPFTHSPFSTRDRWNILNQAYFKSLIQLNTYIYNAQIQSWFGFLSVASAHSIYYFVRFYLLQADRSLRAHEAITLLVETLQIGLCSLGMYCLKKSDNPYNESIAYQQTVNKFRSSLMDDFKINCFRQQKILELAKQYIDRLKLMRGRPSITELLKLKATQQLHKCKKVENVNNDDVIIIRKKTQSTLNFLSNEPQRIEPIEVFIYNFLLVLAELSPINLIDPITHQKISLSDAVFVSTGHQFDVYQIGKLEHNVLTRLAFSSRDQNHIRRVMASKIIKPFVKISMHEKFTSKGFLFLHLWSILSCYMMIAIFAFLKDDEAYHVLKFLNQYIGGFTAGLMVYCCFNYLNESWKGLRSRRPQNVEGHGYDTQWSYDLGQFISKSRPRSQPGLFLKYRAGADISEDLINVLSTDSSASRKLN